MVPLLAARGIMLEMALDRSPPVPDAGRIAAVVTELVTNAGRATRDGGRITVRLRCHPGRALLTVADQGTGMSPEAMRRAFDPFFTEKKDWRAIGLGLPMCHSVVSALGGTIDIESAPGRGTEVRISMPTAAAA
jgi:signal transduction histidine kinase